MAASRKYVLPIFSTEPAINLVSTKIMTSGMARFFFSMRRALVFSCLCFTSQSDLGENRVWPELAILVLTKRKAGLGDYIDKQDTTRALIGSKTFTITLWAHGKRFLFGIYYI